MVAPSRVLTRPGAGYFATITSASRRPAPSPLLLAALMGEPPSRLPLSAVVHDVLVETRWGASAHTAIPLSGCSSLRAMNREMFPTPWRPHQRGGGSQLAL